MQNFYYLTASVALIAFIIVGSIALIYRSRKYLSGWKQRTSDSIEALENSIDQIYERLGELDPGEGRRSPRRGWLKVRQQKKHIEMLEDKLSKLDVKYTNLVWNSEKENFNNIGLQNNNRYLEGQLQQCNEEKQKLQNDLLIFHHPSDTADLVKENENLKLELIEVRDSINTDTVKLLKDFQALQDRNQVILQENDEVSNKLIQCNSDNEILNDRLSECIKQNASYAETIDKLNQAVGITAVNAYAEGIEDYLIESFKDISQDIASPAAKKQIVDVYLSRANNLEKIKKEGHFSMVNPDPNGNWQAEFLSNQ